MDEAFLPFIAESEMGEDAYPAGDATYPIGEVFIPIEDAAYPIIEADLAWILRTWRLATYTEDGSNQVPPIKTLTFNTDGSYILASGSEQKSGMWTTTLLAVESTLILNRDNGETQYYQILDLGENELNLRTQRDTTQINEGYLPAD